MTERMRRHPMYCQQWDTAPERGNPKTTGTVTFRTQCGYPSDWIATAYTHDGPDSDTSCDVHLSQCVRDLMTECGLDEVSITPYYEATDD